MSAFYDQASLVVVPSGYKSGKIYAQKPLTTDGQLTFTRASTATRVNASGNIETVASGVPRLDYTNSSCPKILLEPQRSNVMTYSQAADNAAWTKRNATVTANAVNGPDGTLSADKLVEDTANDRHDFYQYFPTTSGQSYTLSFFAKAAERTFCFASFGSAALSGDNTYFNLSTGTVVSTPAGITASMVNYGNGWYRCILQGTATLSAAAYFVYGNSNNGTGFVYAGTAGSGTYFFGAQLEAGAYATSYIPTTSAAVTRLAEAAYKTSATSILGQTEGTFFVEISNWQFQLDKVFIGLSDGSLSNYLQISSNGSTGDLQSVIFTAGAPSGLGTLTPTNGQTYKVAVAYKANDYAMYVNGVQIGTLTSKAAPSSLTRFDIFSLDWLSATVQPRSQLAQALIFKTRLTNAQLAELTTL
jgi:hypothetical protein